jgi:hypothetical protein
MRRVRIDCKAEEQLVTDGDNFNFHDSSGQYASIPLHVQSK